MIVFPRKEQLKSIPNQTFLNKLTSSFTYLIFEYNCYYWCSWISVEHIEIWIGFRYV